MLRCGAEFAGAKKRGSVAGISDFRILGIEKKLSASSPAGDVESFLGSGLQSRRMAWEGTEAEEKKPA